MNVNGEKMSKSLNNFITIRELLKDYEIDITGKRDFDFAQVTKGGVSTKCIDPKTMKVNGHDNLYLCGELIDVDSKCGGYNLYFAWATGYIAGNN